ncbi:MAG: endonuclease V [Cytophagales bacterium]|nr:MAG: endonuclease V [Cytophagales bacterium]TAF59567.1 MAG: endonuclease V [Cytophagales bacterium]
MILAFDTYYLPNCAKTACIAFENWQDSSPSHVFTEVKPHSESYQPGEFYKRELPCILSLLASIHLRPIHCLVVDGYVFLDNQQRLGLGGHLYQHLAQKVPVIGVAKTSFKTITTGMQLIQRGKSSKPLYITAIGVSLAEASQNILSMHGDYRIPTLLKQLDNMTKSSIA